MEQSKVIKKEVSREEYDKKVEMAMAHYEYFDRLTREEAIAAAKKEVASEYKVKKE